MGEARLGRDEEIDAAEPEGDLPADPILDPSLEAVVGLSIYARVEAVVGWEELDLGVKTFPKIMAVAENDRVGMGLAPRLALVFPILEAGAEEQLVALADHERRLRHVDLDGYGKYWAGLDRPTRRFLGPRGAESRGEHHGDCRDRNPDFPHLFSSEAMPATKIEIIVSMSSRLRASSAFGAASSARRSP